MGTESNSRQLGNLRHTTVEAYRQVPIAARKHYFCNSLATLFFLFECMFVLGKYIIQGQSSSSVDISNRGVHKELKALQPITMDQISRHRQGHRDPDHICHIRGAYSSRDKLKESVLSIVVKVMVSGN